MRVYVQVKQLGKRKCNIEKIPVDFPVPPVDVQGLIEAIVSWQVCEYNERLQQSEVLKYLTQEEVENKATSGKVGFAVNYNGKPCRRSRSNHQRPAILRGRNFPYLH